MKANEYTFKAANGEIVSFVGPICTDIAIYALINNWRVMLYNSVYRAGDISVSFHASPITGALSLIWCDLPPRKPDLKKWSGDLTQILSLPAGEDNELCPSEAKARAILATGKELPEELKAELGAYRTPEFEVTCNSLSKVALRAAVYSVVASLWLLEVIKGSPQLNGSLLTWLASAGIILGLLMGLASLGFYKRSNLKMNACVMISVAIIDALSRVLALLGNLEVSSIFVLIGLLLDAWVVGQASSVLRALNEQPQIATERTKNSEQTGGPDSPTGSMSA